MSEGFDDGYETVADDMQDAAADADTRIVPFIDPDLSLCPVVPLGFTGGKVVFAMPEGEIRVELAAKIGTMIRTDIFACSAGVSFLTNWRDAEDKFQRELATIWFVRKCRQAGIWDSARPMRELGVWPGDEGQVVVHLGDRLWVKPERGKGEDLSIFEALRGRKSGPLYRLRPPAPRPAKPASVDDGQWARDWLDRWGFERLGTAGLTGADLVAGWMMAALLGGVAPFRGHLLIHALAGSGKTELMLFLHALLSALAGDVIDAFTEAGLKNELAGNARPVLIDEAEGGTTAHGPGAVEKALDILRRMATGKGGHGLQGDIGGGTVTKTAVGAAALAGISPPRLGPADATRFVEVRLMPLDGDIVARGELEKAKARARELAPRLLGRAIKGAWRYRADVDQVTAAMVRIGQSPRAADLVAMLIAGRRLLLFDEPLSAEEAEGEVRVWTPLLEAREAADAVSNVGADAWGLLMAADAGVHRNDRRETVGSLVHRWVTGFADYSDALLAMGLKVIRDSAPDGREGPWLLVANNHPKLERIFGGSKFADWRRCLSQLDTLGEEYRPWTTPTSVRFGIGTKQRALAIPLTPWMEPFPSSRPAPEPDRASEGERSSRVPPPVPEEDVDWPDEF